MELLLEREKWGRGRFYFEVGTRSLVGFRKGEGGGGRGRSVSFLRVIEINIKSEERVFLNVNRMSPRHAVPSVIG